MKKLFGKFNRKYLAAGIAIIVLSFVAINFFANRKISNVAGLSTSGKSLTSQTSSAKATAEINRSFDFTAINQNKNDKNIKFTVTTVERKDQIMVQGEPKMAPKGTDYLLVRLEIENSHSERLALTPSDLIRLDDAGKFFAPDFHNGNVILDPISTKKELIAFVVKADAKQFIFQVGELDGDKQKVEVNY